MPSTPLLPVTETATLAPPLKDLIKLLFLIQHILIHYARTAHTPEYKLEMTFLY